MSKTTRQILEQTKILLEELPNRYGSLKKSGQNIILGTDEIHGCLFEAHIESDYPTEIRLCFRCRSQSMFPEMKLIRPLKGKDQLRLEIRGQIFLLVEENPSAAFQKWIEPLQYADMIQAIHDIAWSVLGHEPEYVPVKREEVFQRIGLPEEFFRRKKEGR